MVPQSWLKPSVTVHSYNVLRQFRQAKFAKGGLILSLSQLLLLYHPPSCLKKNEARLKKVFKIDSKIIISRYLESTECARDHGPYEVKNACRQSEKCVPGTTIVDSI